MLSLTTRKITGFGSSIALAALLLNCATASAAGSAQDQAASLLFRDAANAGRSAIAVPPADRSAPAVDAMDLARHLLSQWPSLPSTREDRRADATPDYTTAEIAAYAGAQETARRMILGSGA